MHHGIGHMVGYPLLLRLAYPTLPPAEIRYPSPLKVSWGKVWIVCMCVALVSTIRLLNFNAPVCAIWMQRIVNKDFSLWRICMFTARQWSCGKVMFSCVSVCPQVGSHMTIIHDALDFSLQVPQPIPPHMEPYPHEKSYCSPLPPASDIWWLTLQTSSNLFNSGPLHQCWLWLLLKEVCSHLLWGLWYCCISLSPLVSVYEGKDWK